MRDPKHDPQPGDVFAIGPRCRFFVSEREDDLVWLYRNGVGQPVRWPIERWWSWMQHAKTIMTAEDADARFAKYAVVRTPDS